jgi:hypothetical protein
MEYKLIVAGGRDYYRYDIVSSYLRLIKSSCDIMDRELVIVCGMANGADSLGLRYADNYGLKVLKYPADWNKYGKKAGYIRNKEMGEVADSALVFWDGKSRGSKLMIDIMKNLGKPVIVISYSGDIIDRYEGNLNDSLYFPPFYKGCEP